MSVIVLVTGAPGAGKSYLRCSRYVVDDFLYNSGGILYTNYPLNVDVIARFCAERCVRMGFFSRLGCGFYSTNPDDFKKRIHIFTKSENLALRSGNLSFLRDFDLEFGRIALDEIHEILPSGASENVSVPWGDFLAQIRHYKCSFEGLTQDISGVNEVLVSRCSVRIELIPVDDVRDPYFKIPVKDWAELFAGFTGEYKSFVGYNELTKNSLGRWGRAHTSKVYLNPQYFKFYNSYSAPFSDSGKKRIDGFPK